MVSYIFFLLLCLILFRPINITSMCKLCATSPNNVNVSWAVESGKAHTVSVYLVENLTYQDLLNRLAGSVGDPRYFGPDPRIRTPD
jgi:hypothetical protein